MKHLFTLALLFSTVQLSAHIARKRQEEAIVSEVYARRFGRSQSEACADSFVTPQQMLEANREAYALIEKRLGIYNPV